MYKTSKGFLTAIFEALERFKFTKAVNFSKNCMRYDKEIEK